MPPLMKSRGACDCLCLDCQCCGASVAYEIASSGFNNTICPWWQFRNESGDFVDANSIYREVMKVYTIGQIYSSTVGKTPDGSTSSSFARAFLFTAIDDPATTPLTSTYTSLFSGTLIWNSFTSSWRGVISDPVNDGPALLLELCPKVSGGSTRLEGHFVVNQAEPILVPVRGSSHSSPSDSTFRLSANPYQQDDPCADRTLPVHDNLYGSDANSFNNPSVDDVPAWWTKQIQTFSVDAYSLTGCSCGSDIDVAAHKIWPYNWVASGFIRSVSCSPEQSNLGRFEWESQVHDGNDCIDGSPSDDPKDYFITVLRRPVFILSGASLSADVEAQVQLRQVNIDTNVTVNTARFDLADPDSYDPLGSNEFDYTSGSLSGSCTLPSSITVHTPSFDNTPLP